MFDKAIRCDTDNRFVEDNFNNIVDVLEGGNSIWLHCWCTGHTRCEMVTSEYESKLKEKYGDRLEITHDLFTIYKLKEN